MYKIILNMTIITSLLINSTGQSYVSEAGSRYTLRPAAAKVSNLKPPEQSADELDYADIAFDLIDRYAKLAEDYDSAVVRKKLIETLDPLFEKSSADDFQSFLNMIEIGLSDYLKGLKLKDQRLSQITMQSFRKMKALFENRNIYKSDTFLDEFHKDHLIVDTNEFIKNGSRITIEEMFTRFSKKHPDKLKSPESVLLIICEDNGELISKEGFKKKGKCVMKGQKYWVVYTYPHHKEQKFPAPEAVILKGAKLTVQDVEKMDNAISKFNSLLREDGRKDACILLIEQLVTSSKRSHLGMAKIIMLYISKKILEDEPIDMPHYGIFLRGLLLRLMRDEAVEAMITQIIVRMYQGGEHHKSDGEYSKAFDFLLSLLIDNGTKEIYPIAIHSLMELEVYSRDREFIMSNDAFSVQWEMVERLPLFVQSMLLSDEHDIREALILKSLDVFGKGYLPLMPVRYAEERYGDVSDIVFKEIVPYISYISSADNEESSSRDGACANAGKLLWQFGQRTLIDFIDVIINEKSPLARERMFILLENAYGINSGLYSRIKIHDQWYGRQFSERFIDAILKLAMELKTPLRTRYLTKAVLDIHPDYRREEVAATLSSLVKDRARTDISFLLDVLIDIKADNAKDIVASQFLALDSPLRDQALEYLTALKDPAIFEKVWPYIVELESSADNLEYDDIHATGKYFCSVLEPNPDAELTPEQKERIAAFAHRNIWDKEPTGLPWDEYQNNSMMSIWISLDGFIGTKERLSDLESLARHVNEHKDWIAPIVLALIRFQSEEAESRLYSLAEDILALEMNGWGLMRELEKVYDADLTSEQIRRRREFFRCILKAQLNRRREFFTHIIDLSVLNELKDKFEKVFELFVFRDTEGALEALETERWFDVDISDVDLRHHMPEKNRADMRIEQFLPENIRPYFMNWALAHLKDHKRIDSLSLLDKKAEAIERIRKLVYEVLLNDLSMDTEWLGGKGVMDIPKTLFDLIFAKDPKYSNREEKLMSLVMLKPIDDMVILRPDISEKEVVASAWSALKTHDPAFYLPLEHRMKKYLRWLYDKKILTKDSSLVLDRFCAYFLKGKANYFTRSNLASVKDIYKNIDKAGDFYRKNVLSFFYPSGVPPELYPEHWSHPGIINSKLNDFRGVFLRGTISLLLKHLGEERYAGLGKAKISPWAMFDNKKAGADKLIIANDKAVPVLPELKDANIIISISSSA
ncbi:MAG: hypothetical protein ABH843_00725 [Candidatus Omnitrophota bacterium]